MIRCLGLVLGLIFSGSVWGQGSTAPGATHGTADILAPGEWEVGLYAPLRRGFENGWELAVHPIAALLAPHVVAKKSWTDKKGRWALSTQHGIQIPTLMLRALARPGIGGLLPADAEVPFIAALDTRLLATRDMGEDTRLTLVARVMTGVEVGESRWPSFDAPIAYTRTVAYQDTLSASVGSQLDGAIVNRLMYRVKVDGWFLPWSEGTWGIEGKGTVAWRHSERFAAQLSGLAVVGAYPYGNNWHLLPGFDLIWGF